VAEDGGKCYGVRVDSFDIWQVKVTGCKQGMLNIQKWTEQNEAIGVVVCSFLAKFLQRLKVQVIIRCERARCYHDIERGVDVSIVEALIYIIESHCRRCSRRQKRYREDLFNGEIFTRGIDSTESDDLPREEIQAWN